MAIRNWHPGKLIILWSWGVVVAGLALTAFVATSVPGSPGAHLIELAVAILVPGTLSAITWRWLGAKEKAD